MTDEIPKSGKHEHLLDEQIAKKDYCIARNFGRPKIWQIWKNRPNFNRQNPSRLSNLSMDVRPCLGVSRLWPIQRCSFSGISKPATYLIHNRTFSHL